MSGEVTDKFRVEKRIHLTDADVFVAVLEYVKRRFVLPDDVRVGVSFQYHQGGEVTAGVSWECEEDEEVAPRRAVVDGTGS